NLSSIDERRQIKTGECLPSVFRIKDNHISVPEPEFIEPSQIFGPSHCGLHEEGNFLARCRLSHRGLGPNSDNTSLMQEREIVLAFDVVSTEVVLAKVAVGE